MVDYWALNKQGHRFLLVHFGAGLVLFSLHNLNFNLDQQKAAKCAKLLVMKRAVIIVEKDPKFAREIKEALGGVDASLEFFEFPDLNLFVTWFQEQIQKIKKINDTYKQQAEEAANQPVPLGATPQKPPEFVEIKNPDNLEIRMVVCPSDYFSEKGFTLLQRIREYFVKQEMCKADNITSFVLTAFETDQFDFYKYEKSIVSNVLFKPFDKLILREHLGVAYAGLKGSKAGEIYKQKTSIQIEMLKDVYTSRFSDYGFSSISDRELAIGTQSKYYSPHFASKVGTSLHAKLMSCTPSKKQSGKFDCDFAFFNIDHGKLSSLRKYVRAEEDVVERKFPKDSAAPKKNFKFVVLNPQGAYSVKASLEASFGNISVVEYSDFAELVQELDPAAKSFGGDTKKKEKSPLPLPLLKIAVEPKSKKILKYDPVPPETAELLGVTVKKTLEGENPLMRVHNDDRERWFDLCHKGLPRGGQTQIFRFHNHENKIFFIKLISIQSSSIDKVGDISWIELTECTDQEKVSFLKGAGKLPVSIDALFFDASYLGENYSERWNLIYNLVKDRNMAEKSGPAKFFAISEKHQNSDEILEKNAPFEDVFEKPIDSPFFTKKLKMIFPQLVHLEELDFTYSKKPELLKVAQPVTALEISESGFMLRYPRPIEVGSFRKIVLSLPHTVGNPEFLGVCIGHQEVEIELKDKSKVKVYDCSFVFFGVRDATLRHIRNWIKDYYVSTKAAGE